MSVARCLKVTAALGLALWAWHQGLALSGVRWSPWPSFAEMVETDKAVIYRAGPHEIPEAQEQRSLEERKEAASWEMLRHLTIEIERPRSIPGSSLPSAPKREKFPRCPQ